MGSRYSDCQGILEHILCVHHSCLVILSIDRATGRAILMILGMTQLETKLKYRLNIPDSDRILVDHLHSNSMVPHTEDHKWWIAGGSVLQWYKEQNTASDIDIYFNSADTCKLFKERLQREPQPLLDHQLQVVLTYDSSNATTFDVTLYKDLPNDHSYINTWQVQCIHKEFYETPQAMLDQFDITVCQAATDGYQLWVGKYFMHDVRNHRLRFHNMSSQSGKRLLKYWIYGYEPTELELEQIKLETLSWTMTDDYDN